MSEQSKTKISISLKDKWNDKMQIIQNKTGIKGNYFVLGLLVCVILVYLNIFETAITTIVGTLYPGFWTIKSIEKNEFEDQKKWLTYWAVFGSFIILDMFSPIVVKFIPFYVVMKIIFLIYLLIPGSGGCTFIYNLFVKKIIKKYEPEINKFINNIDNATGQYIYNDSPTQKKITKSKLVLDNNFNIDDAAKIAQEINEKEKVE
jgi:receptor expression-enhancing protein 5/6